MIGSPHRKIKLRKGQKTLDTGYSTDPDSNTVSQSQSPKRSISIDLDKINQSELQTLIEHQDPVYRPFSPVSPAHQDQAEESSVTPQIPLFASSDSEKEINETEVVSRHTSKSQKSQKRVELGKRVANYMKGLRESGYVLKMRRSKSQKSGLIFPVARVLKRLKSRFPNMRVQTKAAVMLAGVLEYVCAELMEISGNVSLEMKRKRINPRHINIAVRTDPEFEELMENVEMPSAGTLPMIHPELLKTASKRKRSGATPVKQRVQEEEQSEEGELGEGELEEGELEEGESEEGELEEGESEEGESEEGESEEGESEDEATVMEPLPKKKKPAGYERVDEWQANQEEAEERKTTAVKQKSKKAKHLAKVEQGKRLAEFMRKRREAEKTAIQDLTPQSEADTSRNKENVPVNSQEKSTEAMSETSTEKGTDSDEQDRNSDETTASGTNTTDMFGNMLTVVRMERFSKRKPFEPLENLNH